MLRSTKGLTARTVETLAAAGMYPDGNGLYLQISASGGRSWIFRYTLRGRSREMGLGSARHIALAEARELARQYQTLKAKGIDPIEHRSREQASEQMAQARAITFKTAAEACIAAKSPEWKNAKHKQQWGNTLAEYAYPVLGNVSVQDVDVALLTKVLNPIWLKRTETANRVRQRIETVLDWATASKLREGDNPARWRGGLANLFPSRGKVRRVRNMPALSWKGLPQFMSVLRGQEGTAARALEFLILTACRTSEAIGARWDEIDLEAAVWTVPPERIKCGKEHRVPLSEPAVAVLKSMATHRTGAFVFPGAKRNKPLSNMALLALLKRMGRTDITAHGFRSTFRDWASEKTTHERDVVEMALAHAIPNKVEASYRRGDLFEKRKVLMADFGKYCAAAPVIPFRQSVAVGMASS